MKVAPQTRRNLSRLYGLSVDQWLALIAPGRCPLCEKRYSSTRRPVLDHRHRDGLVRGCPCAPCNYRLGLLHDDDGWLRRAHLYLTDPPAVHLIGIHRVPGSPPTLG